jgi:protein subunit release factor B
MFPVSAAKTQALAERLDRLGIRDEDLEEHFVRSRGRGGQNVNKVKCQRERSQALNRFHARRILADKIERARLGAVSAEAERIARLRRQKRRRSRRAKEKMLADKHARGEIKARRARIVEEGE